jgi:hypothetical protein
MRAVWGKQFPYEIQRLHAIYGDTVRVAPNKLSFMNPTAWDDIYSNVEGANGEAFRKSELGTVIPMEGPHPSSRQLI